jgi:hypothetical protein
MSSSAKITPNRHTKLSDGSDQETIVSHDRQNTNGRDDKEISLDNSKPFGEQLKAYFLEESPTFRRLDELKQEASIFVRSFGLGWLKTDMRVLRRCDTAQQQNHSSASSEREQTRSMQQASSASTL